MSIRTRPDGWPDGWPDRPPQGPQAPHEHTPHPTSHLSHSALQCYRQCGARYRLERIERVPQAPSGALILGSAVHAVFEQAGRALLTDTVRRDAATLSAMGLSVTFLHAFQRELTAGDPLHCVSYEAASLLAARGLAIVAAWHERVLPHYHPVAVEETFTGPLLADVTCSGDPVPSVPADTLDSSPDPLAAWTFTGRRDARTLARRHPHAAHPRPTSLDWKTAERPWSEEKAQRDGWAQATAYAWGDLLDDRPISEQFTFVVLSTAVREGWRPPSVEEAHLVDPDQLDDAITVSIHYWTLTPTLDDVRRYQRDAWISAQRIAAGRFEANPGPLCCWCGVLPHCPTGQHWIAAQQRHQPTRAIQRFAETLKHNEQHEERGESTT
jgi:hypothetical protein